MAVVEPTTRRPVSVFAHLEGEMWQRIEVEVEFVARLAGGQPRDPELVEGWIRTKMGITDEQEVKRLARQHLAEMGVDESAVVNTDTIDDLSEKIAGVKMMGFKYDSERRPCLEDRHVKALIKESVNILYGKELWGPTRKGPKGYTAERIYVEEKLIPVGVMEQVGQDVAIGHLTGKQGRYSTLTPYEYVEDATAAFTIRQLRDQRQGSKTFGEPSITADQWARIFAHGEWNGLGAMRSQGFGQFVTTRFDVTE